MTVDWVGWHDAYADPSSELSQRLNDVIQAIGSALDTTAPGPVRLLSLCAGDARDIAYVLRTHPRGSDLTGCVVELNPVLAGHAAANLGGTGGRVEVRCADAADPGAWQDSLPADVLLLVGIFGNINDADVERTITAVPMICRVGATIVWTRHRHAPDLTPSIRTWFDNIGCQSESLASPGPNRYAVGTEKYTDERQPGPLPHRLFSFVEVAD